MKLIKKVLMIVSSFILVMGLFILPGSLMAGLKMSPAGG